MKRTWYSRTGLFLGTFVSSLLLVFGIGTLAALFLPGIVTLVSDFDYQPQLPIAAARDDAFVDNSLPAKELFPALSDPQNVVPGNWIRIPSIGVDVPLVLSPSLEDSDVIKTLDLGAALYPNGIEPGRLGNTFVSAHSTGNPWQGKYRFAFLRIGEVEPGAELHLDWEGARYTYKLTHNRIVVPEPDFRVVSDRPIPTVTFMACWPLWSTDKRMLWHGELTNVTQLTERPA